MKTLKLTFLLFSLFSITSFSYSQIGDLNKLSKKLEKKTERAVENAVDRNADKAINKTVKKAEDEVTKPSDKTSKSKAGNKSDEQATTVKPDESGNVIYVSKQNGNNKNDGSKSSPLKNLDKAIQIAQPGSSIFIAGGIEMGTLNVGFIESDKPVKIFGSYDENFTGQDIKAHPTVIQPDNESARSTRKAVMKFTKDVAGTVLDNIVFDGGQRNAYHVKDGIVSGIEGGRLLPSTEKPAVGYSTVDEPLLQFVSATTGGDVTIQNCVFTNGASFALQGGHRSGKFTVRNNVFVGNKMAAIEIYGTCASTGGPNTLSLCGEVEIANNTILFTWSRLKDFLDMGYGVRVMTKCDYNIHHNIIGASILAGVDHTRFNKNEWVKVDNNIFFVNKDKDLHYSPASNTRLRIDAGDFGDLEIASAEGNKNEIPKQLKVNKDYLEGYLSARYSEQTDFDRNSPSNQWRSALGMNMQGTIASKVTMFCNKYPWKDALDLFGNVSGLGAQ
ncbi:MAG: right-handed parallel beta-helix repeat-containing protein [Saprospiraceae bacterium]|nr:right-handed parallel beta-helix repeat-containing protein [Saprospiraceae bacterium]